MFDAAGTGALSGVVTDKLAGGWWDGVANAKDERPVLELQAIHDEARKRLTSIVLETFESAFKTYAPAPGDEAEAAQDLLAAVAETSTKEWLLGSRAAAAEATSAADGSAFEEESEDGAVDEVMMRRAGDLAAGLIVVDQVESPGSKSALYVNLLSHMASLSEAAKAPSEDGEMAEAAIELAAAAKQREDEGLISMAAVSVTVLEDAALRVSEAQWRPRPLRGSRGSPRPASESRGRRVASKRAHGRRHGGGREKDGAPRRLVRVQGRRGLRAAGAAPAEVDAARSRSLETRSRASVAREQLQGRRRHVRGLARAHGPGRERRHRDEADQHLPPHRTGAGARLKMIVSMFLEFADVVVPVAQSALNNAKQFSVAAGHPHRTIARARVPRHQGEHERRERKRQQRREQRATLRVRAIARRSAYFISPAPGRRSNHQ